MALTVRAATNEYARGDGTVTNFDRVVHLSGAPIRE